MNQYLLLRDNKQTGPYTVEELAAKGLKAYDLVWLEGKSAAWRYPSEIAELKPFAPVVEEQPYDRFYKKPAQETHAQLAQAERSTWKENRKEIIASASNSLAQKAEPVKEESYPEPVARQEEQDILPPEEPTVHPKKIYVTMPGGKRQSAEKKEKIQKASFSQSINTVTEERPAQAPLKKKEEPLPVVPMSDSYPDELPAEDLYTQLQSAAKKNHKSVRGRSSMRPVMLGLMAACLLLVGVIIGLYISGSKDHSQQKALDDLVKQIQEREQQKNAAQPLSPDPSIQNAQETVLDSNTNVLNGQDKTGEEKVPVSTVSRKNPNNGAKESAPNSALPASNPQQVEPVTANTAALEEATNDKVTYQEAALEAARKNIHQMVLVENSKFKTGVLGGISNLHMTLSNNSRFPLDQVAIEIKYYGPEQKLVKTQTLLFNDMAPGEQKTLEAPRTSRGVTIDYSITRIQSKVLGLAQHRF